MLGDGEMLKDADQRHHNDAHAQLLHDLQRRQAAVSCRVSCCIGCGISCWMGSCTLGAVKAKVPGQLEAGQARFNLEKKLSLRRNNMVNISLGSEFSLL
jgi:hypothetical protein